MVFQKDDNPIFKPNVNYPWYQILTNPEKTSIFDNDKNKGEYIELYNQSTVSVDLSGWRLRGGIRYEIPAGTVLTGGEYCVIGKNREGLLARYPLAQRARLREVDRFAPGRLAPRPGSHPVGCAAWRAHVCPCSTA